MKVLIVGSLPSKDSTGIEPFKKICHDLGAKLAEANCELIVGSDSENTADRHVVDSYISKAKTPKLAIIRPQHGDTPFPSLPDNVEKRYERQGRAWGSSRVHQALASDVVIAIGGNRGTDLLAQTALAVGRPVLPIASAGGMAEQLWKDVQSDIADLKGMPRNLNNLAETWSADHAQIVVECLNPLKKKNPYKRSGVGKKIGNLLFTLALLISWIFFTTSSPFGGFVTFFILLGFAVVLGTNLKTILTQLDNGTDEADFGQALMETTAGLIVAMGLALLFFAGGFVVNGSWDFAALSNQSDVLRVGIIMSLIGLSSGFLLEAAIKKLREKLSGVLNEH